VSNQSTDTSVAETALKRAPASRGHIHPHHQSFSFARVFAIASNTLLELVRLKVFYFLLIFALVLIGSSAFMINFTFQEQFQVLKDSSLGAMSIFTWLLAVLATAMLLPKDIEDRTLYTILAKPVPRFEYLLGKLLGVLGLLFISTVVMTGLFFTVLYARQELEIAKVVQESAAMAKGMEAAAETATEAVTGTVASVSEQTAAAVKAIKDSTFSWSLGPAIVAIYLKAALFAALTLLISTFASSWIFTIVTSVAIYFIGTIQPIAREYWLANNAGTPLAKAFLALVALLFPDLQLFNLVDDIVAGNTISNILFLKTASLGVVYVTVYLFLAYFIFSKKEL